ncbi:type II toxin-antitoxin system Phd/YefM family antitoxin [Bordetella genomosp. 5]|uniref:Antitoxin n=1 Tax=Bordetella genomosp. 5 TaxID=1395608 RepID=A0A261TAM4_9BORD|nr:type II toxin-antitoxin system Phd/YefM family antitoxin [Bordetella genomosp. 5]OZI46684.1 prevent-host-death protein [Bordetella genomosp. 5]
MEHVLAARSVSIAELKRSPNAVFEMAATEPVAVLNNNRPAAYLLSPEVYEAMLRRLNVDLRDAIQEGIDSGPAIAADTVLNELEARYGAESKPAASQVADTATARRKRQTK